MAAVLLPNRYSPPVSSPLNPESSYGSVSDRPRASRTRKLPLRKLNYPASPTERLLRQKAAAAFMSQALNDALVQAHAARVSRIIGRALEQSRIRKMRDRAERTELMALDGDISLAAPTSSETENEKVGWVRPATISDFHVVDLSAGTEYTHGEAILRVNRPVSSSVRARRLAVVLIMLFLVFLLPLAHFHTIRKFAHEHHRPPPL